MKSFNCDKYFKYAPRNSRDTWKSTSIASCQGDISSLKKVEQDFSVCSQCGGKGIYLSASTHRKKTYKSCDKCTN